jgi:signal transduction histidine kinase
MDQRTVVILSDDPVFCCALTSRWQTERNVPTFTVVSGDSWRGVNAETCDLIILGGLPWERTYQALTFLSFLEKPLLLVCREPVAAKVVHEKFPAVMVLKETEEWLDSVMLLAAECLRRVAAQARALQAEKAVAALEREAVLGRYMVEMRHGLNNALTSVLGNAELVLLEPGILSGEARLQVETIRNMAMRVNEVLQRFTSLETELRTVETHTEQIRAKARASAN